MPLSLQPSGWSSSTGGKILTHCCRAPVAGTVQQQTGLGHSNVNVEAKEVFHQKGLKAVLGPPLRRCGADVGARRGAPPAPPLPPRSPGARAQESRRVNPPGGGGDGRTRRSSRRPLPRTNLRRGRRCRCTAGLPAAAATAPESGRLRSPPRSAAGEAALHRRRLGPPLPAAAGSRAPGAAARSHGAPRRSRRLPGRLGARSCSLPAAPAPHAPRSAAPAAAAGGGAPARSPAHHRCRPSPAQRRVSIAGGSGGGGAERRDQGRGGDRPSRPRSAPPLPRMCGGRRGGDVASWGGGRCRGRAGARRGRELPPSPVQQSRRAPVPRCQPAPGEGGCRLWRAPVQHAPTRGSRLRGPSGASSAALRVRGCQPGGGSPRRAGFVPGSRCGVSLCHPAARAPAAPALNVCF
ncbi:uncharacterized protein LOC141729355 [Zonotrichia albicollis]|uniref:uncharacterized protein LOC141729355 n=1 Tax=Zonotrichia albicollis TaxID=44394 RepID=UPI003D80FA61